MLADLMVPFAFLFGASGFWFWQQRKKERMTRLLAAFQTGNAQSALPRYRFVAKRRDLIASVLAGSGVFAMANWFDLPVWLTPILAVVCGLAAHRVILHYRYARSRRLFAADFPEAVENLARAVQSGVPMEKALTGIGELFRGEVGDSFRTLVRQLEIGMPFRDALANMGSRYNLPDVDFFCSVLSLNRDTGGPLSQILANLSGTLRAREGAARRLQVLTAEARSSARIVSLLPLALIGLQWILNPQQIDFMLYDPAGRQVFGYCAVSIVVGLVLIRRMSRF